MKIDSDLKLFSEKYDEEAIKSIDEISSDRSLKIGESTIKVFNIKESFDMFSSYLKGYGEYKISNKNNEDISPQEIIRESVSNFINGNLFVEEYIPYEKLPIFIESYIQGINEIIKVSNDIKTAMMEAGVYMEDIGDVNDFCDEFIDKFHESFDPCMDRILWASGYNYKKRMKEILNKPKREIPVFL